jgi:hypothetical protein
VSTSYSVNQHHLLLLLLLLPPFLLQVLLQPLL